MNADELMMYPEAGSVFEITNHGAIGLKSRKYEV
jgi:hypothetical protein